MAGMKEIDASITVTVLGQTAKSLALRELGSEGKSLYLPLSVIRGALDHPGGRMTLRVAAWWPKKAGLPYTPIEAPEDAPRRPRSPTDPTPEDHLHLRGVPVVRAPQPPAPSAPPPRPTLTLSPDQEVARQSVLRAWRAGARVVVLTGCAGSGKTTLLQILAADFEESGAAVVLMAPTGKAAGRARDVTGRTVTTIHRVLYTVFGEQELTRTRADGTTENYTQPTFEEPSAPCPPGGVVIADEGSMIGEKLYNDLVEAMPPDALLFIVGDRNQLPPVNDRIGPDFINPTAVLETIHRQSEGNPIIRYSFSVSQGTYFDWAGVDPNRLWRGAASYEAVVHWFVQWIKAKEDVALVCGTNTTRSAINKMVRQALGYTQVNRPLVPGERVLIRKNNHLRSWMNGDVLEVTSVAPAHEEWLPSDIGHVTGRIRFAGETHDALVIAPLIGATQNDYVKVIGRIKGHLRNRMSMGDAAEFERSGTMPPEMQREFIGLASFVHLDFGYCLTTHTSQGSQFRRVGIIEDAGFRSMLNRPDGRNLAYTAITRAQEQVCLFHIV